MPGLLLGALPLIVYNIHSPNATLRSNVHLSVEGVDAKLASLRLTLDGAVLFKVIAAMDDEGHPKTPVSWMEGHLGRPYHSPQLYGVLLAILSAPWWWGTRGSVAGIFALTFAFCQRWTAPL